MMAGDEGTSGGAGGSDDGREATAPTAQQRMVEPPPSRVEALDGSNYEDWSSRMKSAFKRY